VVQRLRPRVSAQHAETFGEAALRAHHQAVVIHKPLRRKLHADVRELREGTVALRGCWCKPVRRPLIQGHASARKLAREIAEDAGIYDEPARQLPLDGQVELLRVTRAAVLFEEPPGRSGGPTHA